MPVPIIANDRIVARTVRLVDDDIMQGVVPYRDAMERARLLGMDLVLVATGDPPVCRIINADRFRFERAKQDREQARRQRELQVEVKEIQLRPVTTANDLSIKARKARGFLDEGDKVKVVMRFKGRERSHKQNGRDIIRNFLSILGDHKVEKPLGEGEGDMMTIVAPTVSKADLLRAREQDNAKAD